MPNLQTWRGEKSGYGLPSEVPVQFNRPVVNEHRTAVFRADASEELGGGHVMRCLTLATAFVEAGWHVDSPSMPRRCPLCRRSSRQSRTFWS